MGIEVGWPFPRCNEDPVCILSYIFELRIQLNEQAMIMLNFPFTGRMAQTVRRREQPAVLTSPMLLR